MTLFPLEKGSLPVTIYANLYPSNPYAAVSWFRALDLANRGMLAHTLIEEGLMEFDPKDKWFLAVKALEAKGIRKGVMPSEVAAVLGCAPSTARRHMLRGEEYLLAIFGLNVAFASRNNVWRIATREEAALKARTMSLELKAKYKRLKMYSPHAALAGGVPVSIQMELFTKLPKPQKSGKNEAAD